MSKQSIIERRIVLYAGRVQGVGFRLTTQHAATGSTVTGYVRNLADGRVELVCEGPANELDRFLAEVDARLGHFVASTQTSREAARGEFQDFSIRR